MVKFNPEYTTLNRLRAIDEIESTADDSLLIAFIQQASMWLTTTANREFLPFVDTRYYDALSRNAYGHTLYLDDSDLLEVSSLAVAGTTIPASQYVLHPNNSWPKDSIVLVTSSTYNLSDYQTNRQQSIVVTGTFGFHNNWPAAWATTGQTVLDDPLPAGQTTITVADVSAFEVRQYLRIEDEYLQVTAIDTVDDELTVERGINGTTAVEHAATTAIDRYRQIPDIQLATEKLAVYLYQHRDSIQDVVQALDTGITVRSDAVTFAKLTTMRYFRYSIGAT